MKILVSLLLAAARLLARRGGGRPAALHAVLVPREQ